MTVRMTSMVIDSDSIGKAGGGGSEISGQAQYSQSSSALNNVNSGNSNNSAIHVQTYNWFFDKYELKRTPSILDGITYERERRYRNEGSRFILNVGSQMKLRYNTLATGVVYFHRFYMFHSFKVFPRYLTAAGCLFLAGKAEETPKKCKDIIKIARTLLTDAQMQMFGEDPKEELLTMERIVLQTIRFDLQVDHPYKFLVNYAKIFKGNKDQIHSVLQMAWTFTNDSLCTTICLQWEPEIVAIAMVFLASKIKYEINEWEGRQPHHKNWWDMYVDDLTVEYLEDICHQVLDLYSNPNAIEPEPKNSPVQLSPVSAQKQHPAPHHHPHHLQTASNIPSQQPRPNTVPVAPVPSVNALFPPPLGAGQLRFSVGSAPPPPPPNNSATNSSQTLPGAGLQPPPPPPIPPQWDPNMASFYQNYKFGLVGIPPVNANPASTVVGSHLGHQAPIVPGTLPPPPPPPPGLGPLHTLSMARLPPPPQPPMPPTIPSFVPTANPVNPNRKM